MKEIITEAAFRKRMESSPLGGFLFFGDEDYLKHHALKMARAAVCPDPSLAVFNDMNVDCSTQGFSADAISSAIAAAPMMAEAKIVTVSGLCVNDLKDSELNELCDAIASLDEFDFNTFIISVPAGMIDTGYLPRSPSAALSKLCERLTPVHFARVPDAKLASWAVRHFDHRGVKAESGVASALLSRCGRDMFTLANEIDKLSFFVLSKGRNTVSQADVEHVTSATEDFDTFALSNAVMEGNAEAAVNILGIMKAQKLEPVAILAELTKTFSDMLAVKILTASGKPPSEIGGLLGRMHEYRVTLYQKSVADVPIEKLRASLEMCAEADKALKLSPTGYVEIEKLVCSAV
jgi:DNA polymerase-3 subunit delta